MPTLVAPDKTTLVKVACICDSGGGKTGALASLVKAGYHLRILDYDNKIAGGILPRVLNPQELQRVQYIPLRDRIAVLPGGSTGVIGQPKAFAQGMKMLDKWEDGSVPADWGPTHVLVIDTLTFMASCAYDWAKAMNPSAKEPRTWFYTAQQQVEDLLSKLTHESFNTNVVVNTHITYIELTEGLKKGFPSSIGKAIGPKIPGYFEHLAIVDRQKGITFTPSPFIDAKTPLLSIPKTLPFLTGLADFFEMAKK